MQSSLTCGAHAHNSCMRQQHASQHTLQPLLQTQHSSSCRPSRQPHNNSPAQAPTHSTRSHSIVARAKPDRGSIAALEAAIGAINGILGAHSKSRQQKQKQQGAGPGQQGSAAAAKTTPGPSKLVSFKAKASGSVPVKEWYKIADDPPVSSSTSSSTSSSSNAASSNGTHSHSGDSSSNSSTTTTTTSSSHKQGSSSKLHVPSKPPALSDWQRSLQAYLSLPLEQYSVLDPSLVTRLPPGTDTELLLTKLLAARKERREQQKQQQQEAQARAEGENASSSSSSSSGTSLEPQMRKLEESVAAEGGSSSNGSGATAANSNAAVSISSDGVTAEDSSEPAAAAAVDSGEAGGSFLLRIPMQDLVGIALEPLLIITVDIDPVHGQVKFHASRLVVGDERFDAEFKVDLQAVMSSKITKQPHIVHADAEHGSPPDTAVSSSSSSAAQAVLGSAARDADSSSSSSSSTSQVAVAVAKGPVLLQTMEDAQHKQQQQQQQQQQPTQQQDQQQQALYWQRTSALSCKVNLSMTLRLPHPLSIVPGPLLSTTASLVARLVMQSLLPSFLELLGTDYGRWATGSSRAAPVGSLVAAGKQHMKQQQQQR